MTTYLNVKSVFTISFACRVCEHQAEHNMDGRNLSRCWWPTIMRMEFASYEAMLQFSMYPEEIILTLIQQCNFFFFGGDEVWKSLNMYSCKASVLSESLAVNNSASQAPVTSFWNLVVFYWMQPSDNHISQSQLITALAAAAILKKLVSLLLWFVLLFAGKMLRFGGTAVIRILHWLTFSRG